MKIKKSFGPFRPKHDPVLEAGNEFHFIWYQKGVLTENIA